MCVINFHRVGEGKLRGGQPSNSRLVLYFDVTRRPLCSVFSSAGRCVSFAFYPAGRCAACALAPRCHAAVGGLWCVRPTLSLSLISGFISVTCYTLDNTYTSNLTSFLGLGQQRTLPSCVLSSVRFLLRGMYNGNLLRVCRSLSASYHGVLAMPPPPARDCAPPYPLLHPRGGRALRSSGPRPQGPAAA